MALDLSLPHSGFHSQRRAFNNYPWHVAFFVLCIAALGVWNLASASRSAHAPVWISQLTWMGAGVCAALAIGFVDYRRFMRGAYVFYALVLLLLVAVMLKGRVVMGARRWLTIGPLNLQPSELAKIAVALALARWFHLDAGKRRDGYGLLSLVVPAGMTLVPALLVLKQPDLGTALIVVAVGATIILFARVRWQALVTVVVVVAVGAVFAYPHLKPYQKRRVETYLDPEGDVLGAGYHATQSMIAVGSGQGAGKGWGQGTQTLLSFLPEQHTDFIFSVWAEEHGFVGCLLLLALYYALVVSALGIAGNARDRFGHFLAVGVSGMLFWHVFVNMGMVMAILPVVGVTLPLMSYGGSSIVAVMLGIGLLNNVGMRRFVN
ncbi:MAG: rod shape-determining protein RodA [Anaeromyxobacter sp. RBG_16_69_14]|nr:MAG: rod shape-determining protein RodA [Anaeromyxobacter sp. RBG_16_69_14]